jgi:hypothetical protein
MAIFFFDFTRDDGKVAQGKPVLDGWSAALYTTWSAQ